MKKLMFLFLIMFLFSCEKKEEPSPNVNKVVVKYCWDCIEKMNNSSASYKICNKDSIDIVRYMIAGPYISSGKVDINCTRHIK